MNNIADIMLGAIRAQVCGCEYKIDRNISDDELKALYALSKHHDMAHIVSAELARQGLLKNDEVGAKFKKQQMIAVLRYERINYELSEICRILEEAGIDHIPLKGSVIRDYYPEPWMRTSCDIDILIREMDLNQAVNILVSQANFSINEEKNYHDISLFSPNGVHLELHFNIKENQSNIDTLLSNVWDYCTRSHTKSVCYKMTNEYFVFHHIAHMSYHFLHGGCGVKPFIDLYLMNKKLGYDIHEVKKLCAKCNIDKFYDNVMLLTQIWFGKETYTSTTLKMHDFILIGGVYGTQKNYIFVQSKHHGGKILHMLKRIFMPYQELKIKYPILNKFYLLLPICHIHRWFEIIVNGRFKKSVLELKTIKNSDHNDSQSVANMLSELGL